MGNETESFQKIFDALNSLYKKTDDILFEVETVATEIREMIRKETIAALAEEAFANERKMGLEEKKATETETRRELELW